AFVAPRKLGQYAAGATGRRKEWEAKLLGLVSESVALQMVVRAFDLGGWARGRHDALAKNFTDAAATAHSRGSLVETFTLIAMGAVQTIMIGAGAWLAISGQVS